MATSINIKMYRVGELGDCFLLTFIHGKSKHHMLIDCGSFRNSQASKTRMKAVASNIQTQLGGKKLDVVVGTHQHNDHLSGYVHAEDVFKAIGVDQVWLSWLDDPKDKQAVKIGQSQLKLRKGLAEASDIMQKIGEDKSKAKGLNAHALKTFGLVTELLGFFGAAPQLPAQGIEVLKRIGEEPPAYLSPGELLQIPGIPLSAVKVHVLGPPKNEKLLYRKDPKQGESYDHKLNAMAVMINQFVSALGQHAGLVNPEEVNFPFNEKAKNLIDKPKAFSEQLATVNAAYRNVENAWRNIDNDWLDQASRMALYMDTFTNNSSLVLAFELVKTGKVLLFAADAQTGNWVSWDDVVFKDPGTTTEVLLGKTVFYKVGHHGSHNATLKPAFEKMTNEELIAMIPVDKSDPNITKKGGWKMPAAKLYKRLKELTHNRVLRMDDGYADGCDPKKSAAAKSSWGKLKKGKVNITNLFIEYTVE